MAKFLVYEVWTTTRVVEAENEREAYEKGEPPKRQGLSLCNWHVWRMPASDVPRGTSDTDA